MKNILIVDDIKGWRDFNSNIMQEIYGNNINIETADCAKAAYDLLLQSHPFDIIITDLQMENDFAPKYAGEWLVEQIKSFNRYNNTNIIMISASYNIRHIADDLEVKCIPKSTALKCLTAYKEALGVK